MINTDIQGATRSPTDFDLMSGRFNIDAPKRSRISTHWVGRLTKEPQIGVEYGQKARARAPKRLKMSTGNKPARPEVL